MGDSSNVLITRLGADGEPRNGPERRSAASDSLRVYIQIGTAGIQPRYDESPRAVGYDADGLLIPRLGANGKSLVTPENISRARYLL